MLPALDERVLIVNVFDDELVVVLPVDLVDDGFYRGVAFD